MIESRPNPTPTPESNDIKITTLFGKLDSNAADLKRVEGELLVKDNNIWGTLNRIQEEQNKQGKINWPLIVTVFGAIIGALVSIVSLVVLYTNTTIAPITQKLTDVDSRIVQIWTTQGKALDRLTADEIAAAYAKGRQDEINGKVKP